MPTKVEFAQKIKAKYPDYADIDDVELADRVIAKYPEYSESITETTTPQLKPSTVETLANQAALEQSIQKEAQMPVSERLSTALGELPGLLGRALTTGGQGIADYFSMAGDPSRQAATALETGKRLGLDIGDMITSGTAKGFDIAQRMFSPENLIASIQKSGPMGVNFLNLGVQAATGPRTLTPEEIQAEVEKRPLSEAIAEERSKVSFEGASPAAAELTNQLIQAVAPLPKGFQLVKGAKAVEVESQVARFVRSAIKPSDAKVGAKVEKAVSDEIGDIFLANTNADKAAGVRPIEGFSKQVDSSMKEVGTEISNLRAQVGNKPLQAGKQLADKIRARAQKLREAGQPKEADAMLIRADELDGTMETLDSLQEGVTIANRKGSFFEPKTKAEQFSDEIISQEGGAIINKELENIAGPRGKQLRKKWSNLKTINDNLEKRVSKLINNAPEEIRPALVNALMSVEGIGGAFALANGYLSGAIPIAASVAKSFSKNATKLMKDSDALITRAYDTLRKTPPKPSVARTAAVPPVIRRASPELPSNLTPQDVLNQQMAEQLSQGGGVPPVIEGTIPLEQILGTARLPSRGVPFNPTRPMAGLSDAQIQAINDAINQQMAQSLSTQRIPQIFLPVEP